MISDDQWTDNNSRFVFCTVGIRDKMIVSAVKFWSTGENKIKISVYYFVLHGLSWNLSPVLTTPEPVSEIYQNNWQKWRHDTNTPWKDNNENLLSVKMYNLYVVNGVERICRTFLLNVLIPFYLFGSSCYSITKSRK